MKSIPKVLLLLLITLIIIPQVTFAAWWNPFSWKVFNRTKTPQVEIQKKDPPSEIEKLRSEIEELKKKTKQSTSQYKPLQAPALQIPARSTDNVRESAKKILETVAFYNDRVFRLQEAKQKFEQQVTQLENNLQQVYLLIEGPKDEARYLSLTSTTKDYLASLRQYVTYADTAIRSSRKLVEFLSLPDGDIEAKLQIYYDAADSDYKTLIDYGDAVVIVKDQIRKNALAKFRAGQ